MVRTTTRLVVALISLTAVCGAVALAPTPVAAQEFTTKIFKAAAIGAAVSAAGPQLNKFVNTITFNNRKKLIHRPQNFHTGQLCTDLCTFLGEKTHNIGKHSASRHEH